MKGALSHRAKVFWAFAAIYIIWGSTYLGIQVAVESIPPFLLGAIRFLIAGSILIAWARYRGEAFPPVPEWIAATMMGAMFFVVGNGLVVWAELHVPSGRAALLASTSPIWMVVLESALDGWKRPPARIVSGVILGLLGLYLLVASGKSADEAPVSYAGVIALVCASIGWAIGSVHSHRRPIKAGPAMETGMKMLGGGALLVVVAMVLREPKEWSTAAISTRSWIAFGYLVVFGSLIGFSAFTFLLRVTSPQIVGTSSYVNPVVAVFLGWAIAGETVTARMLLGAAVSLLGVMLIRWPQAPKGEIGSFETGEFSIKSGT